MCSSDLVFIRSDDRQGIAPLLDDFSGPGRRYPQLGPGERTEQLRQRLQRQHAVAATRAPGDVDGDAAPLTGVAIHRIDQNIGVERKAHRQRS